MGQRQAVVSMDCHGSLEQKWSGEQFSKAARDFREEALAWEGIISFSSPWLISCSALYCFAHTKIQTNVNGYKK